MPEHIACVMDENFTGTDIPKEHPESYYTRYKHAYGVNYLLIFSFYLEVLFMHCGFPASVNDSAVSNASVLPALLREGIPFNDDLAILGDSAFASQSGLIVTRNNISHGTPRVKAEYGIANTKVASEYSRVRFVKILISFHQLLVHAAFLVTFASNSQVL